MSVIRRISSVVIIIFLLCQNVNAQQANLIIEQDNYYRAQVLESNINDSGEQDLKVRIEEGVDAGSVINFKNDYIKLKVGDEFYLRVMTQSDGEKFYSVSDVVRSNVLVALLIIFIILLIMFGGKSGMRGLLALILSFYFIFYLLVPGIYKGYNTLLICVSVSSLIIILGSYITHGFNRITTTAVIAMLITIVITSLIGYLAIYHGSFTGLSSEENVYLRYDSNGRIDMLGLLYGGMIIGLLGVLYDIAIGQAVAVAELYRAKRDMNIKEAYRRGIKIGHEHIGALVNTLAIAYVGSSLPLILLIQSSTAPVNYIINSEMFASEIVRILIGSIGLVLAVPVTTMLSAYMLKGVDDHILEGHGHVH